MISENGEPVTLPLAYGKALERAAKAAAEAPIVVKHPDGFWDCAGCDVRWQGPKDEDHADWCGFAELRAALAELEKVS